MIRLLREALWRAVSWPARRRMGVHLSARRPQGPAALRFLGRGAAVPKVSTSASRALAERERLAAQRKAGREYWGYDEPDDGWRPLDL